MKNLTRKLMLSIVAIALVVIALGTSTFAWFTLSNKASVGQFNAEVTAGEGMELSLDQATWYSSIPSSVIQAKIQANFTAASGALNVANEPILTAVTTADALAFNKLKADQSGWEAATANVDFIKIKIYVRAVKLNTVAIDSITVTGNSGSWTADATFLGTDGNTVDAEDVLTVSAANGARVGISGATGVYSTPFVYENAASTSAPLNTVLGGTIPTVLNGQADYFLNKNEVNPNLITGAPSSVIGSVTEVLTTSPIKVIDLTAGTTHNTGNFDLLVWFEGFDPDTYDSILKMPLNIKMSFIGSIVTP